MRRKANNFLKKTFGWLPARMVLAMMSFFGFVNLYMVRINLSVAIVAMVGGTDSASSLAPCLTHTMEYNTTGNGTIVILDQGKTNKKQVGEMDWSESIQGFVLGGFFYGYATTQIVGGRAAEIYGTKWVFGGCILAGGVASILTPVAARLHYGALIALRIIQGICQGVSWPSMHALISRWIPPYERSRFIGYVYFAATLSTSITMLLCGFVIDQLGWAAAFYVTGCLSLAWCLVWFSLMYNTPADHPRISEAELSYIESSIQEQLNTDGNTQKPDRVPWRSVFTSLPVCSIIVLSIGNSWGIYLLFSYLPTYMNNVLGFSISENGMVSSLPFVSRYLGCIIWGTLADCCISRGYCSIHTARRAASAIAMLGPAAALLGVAYNGCGWVSAVVLLCTALFLNGAVSASYMVNHTDLSPNFAGTLLGIENTVASVVGFLSPIFVGFMLEGDQSAMIKWRYVFWSCVPLYIITEIFFLKFSSASVQSWNYKQSQDPPSNSSNTRNVDGADQSNAQPSTNRKSLNSAQELSNDDTTKM